MDKVMNYLRLFFFTARKLLELLVQAGLVGGTFWFAYTVVPEIVKLYFGLDPQFAIGILAAVVSILGSTITPAWLNHIQHKRKLEEDHRKQLIPVYEEWLKLVFGAATPGKRTNYKAFEKVLPQLAQQIMIRGNDDVVNTFYAYIQTARQQQSEEEEQVSETEEQASEKIEKARKMLYTLEDFFFSIRRTLGHQNKHIEQGTLLKFLVHDIPTSLETRENTKVLSEKNTKE